MKVGQSKSVPSVTDRVSIDGFCGESSCDVGNDGGNDPTGQNEIYEIP